MEIEKNNELLQRQEFELAIAGKANRERVCMRCIVKIFEIIIFLIVTNRFKSATNQDRFRVVSNTTVERF